MQQSTKSLYPHCQRENTVKNVKTYYGKQNNKCKSCKHQFVSRLENPIEKAKEELLPLLLLERISLQGICRVFKKSMSWLYLRMKILWDKLPNYLPLGS